MLARVHDANIRGRGRRREFFPVPRKTADKVQPAAIAFPRVIAEAAAGHNTEVEVLEARPDKPITKLATRVVRGDGVVVLDGTAVCYTMPLPG